MSEVPVSDLPFLPEIMKVKKYNKLVCNLNDKENYVLRIITVKQSLNQGLVLKKVHKTLKFNQKAWPKPCTGMNTKLKTEAKDELQKHLKVNEEFSGWKMNAIL